MPYLDRWVTTEYFWVRKVLLVKYSYAFVVMPGGFGTLDELTEALTLIQTRKILQFPIVLMGRDYWSPFIAMIKTMIDAGTISGADLDLMLVTDSVPDAMAHIEQHAVQHFGLKAAEDSSRTKTLPRISARRISRVQGCTGAGVQGCVVHQCTLCTLCTLHPCTLAPLHPCT